MSKIRRIDFCLLFGPFLISMLSLPEIAQCSSYDITDLGSLYNDQWNGTVLGFNNQGQVIGVCQSGALTGSGFLWDAATGMQNLDILAGVSCTPHAINDKSEIVGTISGGNAFLYNGGMIDLGISGVMSAGMYGMHINNQSQIIGNYTTPTDGYTHGFIYQNGITTDLGTLGGNFSYVYKINGKCQVIGESALSGNNSEDAFIYQNGKMTDLGSLYGDYSSPTDINNKGVVIGNSHNGFVYSNGQMTDLGSFWPNSINYKGQIVGNILYSSPDQTILYQNGTITDLGSLVENGNSSPFSINNGGQIAGMSDTQDQGGHSFIYSGGSMKDLNLLINSASWVLNGGVERGSDYMNESGQIAGVASKLINGNYQDRAFILTPFPWKGQGGGSWGNQNNWAVTDMPGNVGDSVYFSNKFGNSSGGTITLDGDRTVSTITFNDPNNVYSINSGNNPTSKIVLVNTDSSWAMLIVTNGNHSVTAPVELQADACVETLLNNTSLNISGQITESGGPKSLTKLDDGLLILSGDNKYTGQTIIEEGILELSSTGQIDKSSNIITDDNGTFQINGGSHTVGSISGTGMTEVISGELTADSIVQDTLTIGSGTEINIANNPGRTLSINDNLSSVPEPSNFALLFVGSMCYCLWGRPVHWIRYEVDGVVFSRLGARKDSKLGVDSSIY